MASDPLLSAAGAPRRIRVVLEDSVVRTIHDPRHYTGPGAPFDPPVAMRVSRAGANERAAPTEFAFPAPAAPRRGQTRCRHPDRRNLAEDYLVSGRPCPRVLRMQVQALSGNEVRKENGTTLTLDGARGTLNRVRIALPQGVEVVTVSASRAQGQINMNLLSGVSNDRQNIFNCDRNGVGHRCEIHAGDGFASEKRFLSVMRSCGKGRTELSVSTPDGQLLQTCERIDDSKRASRACRIDRQTFGNADLRRLIVTLRGGGTVFSGVRLDMKALAPYPETVV
jgi:hypothetical protein